MIPSWEVRTPRGVFASTGLWAVLACAALSGCGDQNQYVEPPPPEVTVAHPIRRDVTDYIEATGTAEPILQVEIRARVRGFLKECLVKEGASVEENQLLLVIDEEPFRVLLDQAKARLAEAETALQKAKQSQAREMMRAQLALDESQLELAISEENRMKPLTASHAVSQEDMDRAIANRKKNEAQVELTRSNLAQTEADYETGISAAEANVQVARTAMRNAEIDLGYCRMTSPTKGRIGRIYYDVGNLVGDGQASLLATVVMYDPIHVYTTLSVNDFLKYRSAADESASDNDPDPEIPIELALGNESEYLHKGKVDYYDPVVDRDTSTIEVRGLFDNADAEILPGMFTRIRIPVSQRSGALLVPEPALGVDQSGSYLLVVGADDKVDYRPVKVGQLDQGMRVVEGNLSPEDRVIVEGLLRARPGAKVVPQFEATAAAPGAAPAKSQASAR